MSKALPGYIYTKFKKRDDLCQGDIIKVSGQFKKKFNEFFKGLNHDDGSYVMVLSQSCDLVRRKKNPRSPIKASHVTLCLVREANKVLDKELELQGKNRVNDCWLFDNYKFDELQTKIARLVNNSDAKNLFYLPKHGNLPADMIAILNLSYPFRSEIYKDLIDNRAARLASEFRAKVGMLIANLYGRVATSDLLDNGWQEKDLYDYAKNLMKQVKVANIIDQKFNQKIKKDKSLQSVATIEKAAEDLQAKEELKKIRHQRSKVLNECKNQIFLLLKDESWLSYLKDLSDSELRKELSKQIK